MNSDLFSHAYVISLPSRRDRRARMTERLKSMQSRSFSFEFVEALTGQSVLNHREYGSRINHYQNWKLIDTTNAFWNRDLLTGELGCAYSHWMAWNLAAATNFQRFLFLEDDVIFSQDFVIRCQQIAAELANISFDILFLGRKKCHPDVASVSPSIAAPGFNYQAHAYILTRAGLDRILRVGFERNLIPVDDFLPALYSEHPRKDLRGLFGDTRLAALATKTDLAWQEKADTDIEGTLFV